MSTSDRARAGAPNKLVVVAGPAPWTGTVYTTRGSARHEFRDEAELVAVVARLTGWSVVAVPLDGG